jgi:hypothetical protein
VPVNSYKQCEPRTLARKPGCYRFHEVFKTKKELERLRNRCTGLSLQTPSINSEETASQRLISEPDDYAHSFSNTYSCFANHQKTLSHMQSTTAIKVTSPTHKESIMTARRESGSGFTVDDLAEEFSGESNILQSRYNRYPALP